MTEQPPDTNKPRYTFSEVLESIKELEELIAATPFKIKRITLADSKPTVWCDIEIFWEPNKRDYWGGK